MRVMVVNLLQEVPFIDLQLVDIRLSVISVPRKGAWLRNNEVTNVNTRVGVGRWYHGDMTALGTTPSYWLCCFNRKLGHCELTWAGYSHRGRVPCIHTRSLFVWVSFRKLTAAAEKITGAYPSRALIRQKPCVLVSWYQPGMGNGNIECYHNMTPPTGTWLSVTQYLKYFALNCWYVEGSTHPPNMK